MKVLFVANRVPYPPYRGDKLKIYNLATRLCAEHEIHLLTIAETKEDISYGAELEKVFKSVTLVHLPKWRSYLYALIGLLGKRPLQVAYFRSSKFRKYVKHALEQGNYDAVHVQHLRMAGFFETLPTRNVILDLPDAFSLYWKRRSENATSWWTKLFAKMEYNRLVRYEKKTLPIFPLNLVCSDEDKDYLTSLTGATLDVLPNGVDTNVFHYREGVGYENGRILFTGNMDYAPNVDAVEYFCQEIFPEILKKVPHAKFIIAGQRPVAKVLALASSNVLVTGFVQNLADEYAKAHIVVAPLRFGAGTQNKVLEALAMRVPVVCTAIGFKGLGIQNGEGAVLAEDTMTMADEAAALLSDNSYRERISNAAGDIIRNKFSWDAVAKNLEHFLQQIAENKSV